MADRTVEAKVALPSFEETEMVVSGAPPSTAAFLVQGTPVSEGLRTLATRLRMDKDRGVLRRLAVTSCIEADGKTSVALGLASTFAHAGEKVLLVDADVRRRQMHRVLGLPPSRGLAEWLESNELVLPLWRIAPAGFHLLTAGEGPCRPELLGSLSMSRLLAGVERSFDRVILDSAPLLPVADTLGLREHVGSFLLIVRAGHTPREAVRRAVNLVGTERFVGAVLNGYVSHLPSRYRHGYGYGYGSYGAKSS